MFFLNFTQTHTIRVWYIIYIHLVDFMIDVGEYTIRGFYGKDSFRFSCIARNLLIGKNPMRQHDKSLRNNFTLGKSRIKSWLKVTFYPGLWVWLEGTKAFKACLNPTWGRQPRHCKWIPCQYDRCSLWDQFWLECFNTAPCQPSQWRARTGFDPDVTSWTAENTKTESFTLKNWWLEDDYKVGP